MSDQIANKHEDSEHALGAASAKTNVAAKAKPKAKAKPRKAPAIAACVIATLVVAASQWRASDGDYQMANLASYAAVLIAGIFVAVLLYRLLRRVGYGYIVPVTIITSIAGFALLFQYDGVTGEMVPIFRYRFAKADGQALQTIPQPSSEKSSAENHSAEQSTADTSTADTSTADKNNQQPSHPDALAPSNTATAPPRPSTGGLVANSDSWQQFLGPNRNGVLASREFQIPQSIDQVTERWKINIGAGWASFAVADGKAITLEQRDDQEALTAYDLNTGTLQWIQTVPGFHHDTLGGTGPRSTPAIHQGKVYATTARGKLLCVNVSDGKPVWSQDLIKLGRWTLEQFDAAVTWGYAPSPLIADDLCIVCVGGPNESKRSTIAALDINTGDVIWTGGEDQISYASPQLMTLAGQRQIVCVNEKTVSGHSLVDGDMLWSFSWPGQSNAAANCAAAIPVGDDQVLVGKHYGGGSTLVKIFDQGDKWQAKQLWHKPSMLKTKFNHTCVQGNIGFGLSNGILEAVDLNEARILWREPRRTRAQAGQVLLVEDTLVIQAEYGDLVLAKASEEDYQELLRIEALDSKTWNIPTVVGNLILVRNDRQAICYQLPSRQ